MGARLVWAFEKFESGVYCCHIQILSYLCVSYWAAEFENIHFTFYHIPSVSHFHLSVPVLLFCSLYPLPLSFFHGTHIHTFTRRVRGSGGRLWTHIKP